MKCSILLLYVSVLSTTYMFIMDTHIKRVLKNSGLYCQGIILREGLINGFVKWHISLVHLKSFKNKNPNMI